MREISFGLVSEFYSADETLIPNASFRGDANQNQTRHSIACLKSYFDETCYPRSAQLHCNATHKLPIAGAMAL